MLLLSRLVIRESYKKVEGIKKYLYLNIIESIRTAKVPTNRSILNLVKVYLPKKKKIVSKI